MSRHICAFTTHQRNLPDFFSLNEETTGIFMTTRHGGVINRIEMTLAQVEETHRQMGEYLARKRAEAEAPVNPPLHHIHV